VVPAGLSVIMSCQSDNRAAKIWWRYYAAGRHFPQPISKGTIVSKEFDRRFNTKNDTHLQITVVELADAGLYVCSEDGINSYAAELFVIR